MAASSLAPLDEVLRAVRGHALTREERDGFTRYLDLLMLWNRTHDLTGCRTAAEVVTRLFRDSLLFLGMLPEREPLRAVDIGAGAGIPGLPLRLVLPSLRVSLIESRRKRVSFLRAVDRELRLQGVEVIEGRAEDIVTQRLDLVGEYDVVLGRGVVPEELLAVAGPYLRSGGMVVAGGPPEPGPLPRSSGYAIVEWRRESVGSLRGTRTFLVARK